MIQQEINFPEDISSKILDLASPKKQGLFISDDFLELMKCNHVSDSTMSMSTNDSNSVRADDETPRPLFSIEDLVLQMSRKIKKSDRKKQVPENQTLKDIISKRVYPENFKQNTAKQNKNKEEVDELALDIEDEIVKKSKLNDGKSKVEKFSRAEKSEKFDKIVMRDGKVKLEVLVALEEDKKKTPLKVVNYVPTKLTSSAFKKNIVSEKWGEEETNKFYKALQLFGTDFSMIARLFPTRNRNQIKNKFLKEEKVAPEKINAAFTRQNKNIDFSDILNQINQVPLDDEVALFKCSSQSEAQFEKSGAEIIQSFIACSIKNERVV